jgi:hypothetical protein
MARARAAVTAMVDHELARRYGAIGRQLKVLDDKLGRENTDDLWTAFSSIRIRDAMASASSRAEAAAELASIEDAIVDRASYDVR